MENKIIGSKELKTKIKDIVYNQTNIEITTNEADQILKEFMEYIKTETCKGNEVLINNFCKILIKKYKNPKKDGFYDKPVAVFSKNFLKGKENNYES